MSRQDELAAERSTASANGDEYAVSTDLFPPCDAGAPLPHVIADGHRTFLTYLVAVHDPNWDGTYVTVKNSASGAVESVAVVEFRSCRAFTLGPPNDEALSGHRLWGKGLEFYTPHVVENSRWLTELEQRNRVHAHHSPSLFAGLVHYVFTFHDETFECITGSHEVTHISSTYAEVLHGIVDRATGR